jgi:aspartyl-tRNA(Asn)/glutamyl-tRNA(Gln) amidotransferase subunit B|tara:strand:+ start:960 stop:2420 length:1461 start_codon:yes stop_codon:yes gene_type:complete
MEYEAVIGLEVHVQLRTRSKMFTRVGQGFGAEPNTLVDPVIMGLPGVLPVLNKEALDQSIRVGLIFDSTIPDVCKWDRKNYFYPDSTKNYQLTQFDQPICDGGKVEIELPGSAPNVMGEHRTVQLTRAHLEEDVGKLTHFERDSLVDYNRAGTPLLEIVTDPDMSYADEAVAFLQALRMHLVEAGISDCDMEKGQMRCDANVSIRPVGSNELRSRWEMKNLNTITGVKNGINYVIRKQTRLYESGKPVYQETHRWDPDAGVTQKMRGKEDAHDYRYFPDPDLMPVRFPRDEVEKLKAVLPERVFDRQRRYQADLKLPYTVTSVICYDHELAQFFEACLKVYGKNPLALANYIANDLQRERGAGVEEGSLPMAELALTPELLGELVKVIDDGMITKQAAKDVFTETFKTGKSPLAIIEEKGLKDDTDDGDLEAICRTAVEGNPKAAAEFREGNAKALNTFIGPVMKATRGKANPQKVQQALRKILGS